MSGPPAARPQVGNLYWGANRQSCLYNALLQSNHLELIDPMFNMYSSPYDTYCESRTATVGQQRNLHHGNNGIDGLAPLPEDIAAEMRDLYLLRKATGQTARKTLQTSRLSY